MTPLALRRQGREAFNPQVSEPLDLCPHQKEFKISLWMEGWYEEEKEHNKQQKEADEKENLHDDIMAEIESLQRSSSVSGLVKLLIDRGILL